MGGGSAQVNPPHQVSIAEGLRALLGDAVTITDGVEVRQRPVAARPGFVVDPDTGDPGTQLIRYSADGHLIDEATTGTRRRSSAMTAPRRMWLG